MLALILVFLSEGRELPDILLIAIATVSSIWDSAYYNEDLEDLSRDLAKTLPFVVLGIFISNTSYFNIDSSLALLREINAPGRASCITCFS